MQPSAVVQHLETLYRKMCETGAVSLELQIGANEKIRLTRRAAFSAAPAAAPVAHAGASAPSAVSQIPSELKISAPLSGVFYRAPAPSAPPFVEEGTAVKKGDVLCIIEAMKVLNEIKAPRDGEIASVLAVNGKHVKKGDPLFVYGN